MATFQLTTSQGGRYGGFNLQTTDKAFQRTTSRGGRPLDGVEYIGFSSFQLTTSRGGRQGSEDNERRYHNISTHDLARRSTKADLKPKEEGEYFNSRPREEVDRNYCAFI